MASKLALARTRQRYQSKQQAYERKAVSVVASATAGYAESAGVLPVEVMGVPTKLALGIGLSLIAGSGSGNLSRYAGAAGEAMMSVYAFEAAKSRSWVAGGMGSVPAGYGMGTEV